MTAQALRDFEDMKTSLDEYKKLNANTKKAFDFLDSCDILPLLKPGTDMIDLDRQIHNAYCAELEDGEEDCFIPITVLMLYIGCRFRFYFEAITYVSWVVPECAQKGTRYDTDTISDVPEVE